MSIALNSRGKAEDRSHKSIRTRRSIVEAVSDRGAVLCSRRFKSLATPDGEELCSEDFNEEDRAALSHQGLIFLRDLRELMHILSGNLARLLHQLDSWNSLSLFLCVLFAPLDIVGSFFSSVLSLKLQIAQR